MYITDQLVFVELHKTGGTHILNMLEKITTGQRVGKHNRVPAELQDRFIIGSVRNPWDWYVSLWAYGCAGRGSVHRQLTRACNINYCIRQLPREMGKKRCSLREFLVQCSRDIRKPVKSWQSLYRDSADVQSFQRWLKMLFQAERRFDMGEGYGFSPVADRFGLMTYRYLKLFTGLGEGLYLADLFAGNRGIEDIWEEQHITSYIIRNEMLEDDLIEALERSGHALEDGDRQMIQSAASNRSNTSKRGRTAEYYNEEAYELVKSRESFIIQQHGYELV